MLKLPPLADDAEPSAAAAAAEAAHPVDVRVPAPAAGTASEPEPAVGTGPSMAPIDAAAALKQRWPALFAGAPKPIKLRIQQDIQERAPGTFTKQALSAFFRRHTGSTSYLHAVANGKVRFDLDGQPSGEVTEEHRQVARDELARRRANQDERRALEDQQRRNRAGLLHDFERTTLTRANFCVLKQVADDALDGLLALARAEAAQRPAPAPRGRPLDTRGPAARASRPNTGRESSR